MNRPHRPLALIILDGWGYSEDLKYNAIQAANTPIWDKLWSNYPHMLINASGASVGLPRDQMGNSEVGHLNLGAGRVVYQEFTRISRSIKTGSFFNNRTLTNAVDCVLDHGKAIHIMGLLSPGGVHSHEEHIYAMIKLAIQRGAKEIYVHAFLDGRDTPPKSAHASINALEKIMLQLGHGKIASIIGRFYALDRDQRWERITKAYQLISDGIGTYNAENASVALDMAYQRDESDEFVQATSIGNQMISIENGDAIFFMNFRSDRARQLTNAFINPQFNSFPLNRNINLSTFVSLTEYKKDFNTPIAFPSEKLNNVLGSYISSLGLQQLRIAETEKYAHVTFFFNGGIDEPFDGEDRILVPSPKIDTYDKKPEMNASELTDNLVNAIKSNKYDVIICNYANADMVGHSGNYDAAIQAVEVLDKHLGIIWSVLSDVGGEMIITADHGNAELMLNEATGQAHTAHTSNPVPLIFVGRKAKCEKHGALSDIAPTMLTLMDLPIPAEMSTHLLISTK